MIATTTEYFLPMRLREEISTCFGAVQNNGFSLIDTVTSPRHSVLSLCISEQIQLVLYFTFHVTKVIIGKHQGSYHIMHDFSFFQWYSFTSDG